MSEASRTRWRAPALLAFGLLFLFCSLRPGPWARVAWTEAWWRPSPDFLVLLALTAVSAWRSGACRIRDHLLVAGLVFVVLFRIPELVFPHMFGQRFVLAQHLGVEGGLFVLLTGGDLQAVHLWLLLGGLLVFGLVWWGLAHCWRSVGMALARPRVAATTLVLLGLVWMGAWVERSLGAGESRFLARSMFIAAFDQLQEFAYRAPMARLVAARTGPDFENLPDKLSGLEGADVVVYFVESYGTSLLRHPAHGARVRGMLDKTAARLDEVGATSRTARCESPVSGALSNCAHASLLSGMPVASYGHETALRSFTLRCLPGMLAAQGYRCVNVQPRMDREVPWSRSFYGFTDDMFAGQEQTYRRGGGIRYHWAEAPDQYVLAQARQRYLRGEAPPAFLMFVGCNTHADFSRVPPVLDDWQQALDPRAHAPIQSTDLGMVWYHENPVAEEFYLRNLEQTFAMLASFMAAAERPTLLLVLGDHQAPRIHDIEPDPGDFSVPLHAISNRAGLVEAWAQHLPHVGMQPGTEPVLPMWDIYRVVREIYGRR